MSVPERGAADACTASLTGTAAALLGVDLPSCPAVNPQLSVMAMALRVAGFAAEGHAARSDADSPPKASTFTL